MFAHRYSFSFYLMMSLTNAMFEGNPNFIALRSSSRVCKSDAMRMLSGGPAKEITTV